MESTTNTTTQKIIHYFNTHWFTFLAGLITTLAIAYNSLIPATKNVISFTGSRFLFVLELFVVIGITFVIGLTKSDSLAKITGKNYYLRVVEFFITYASFTFIINLGLVVSNMTIEKLLTIFNFIYRIDNPTFTLFWLLILAPLYQRWLDNRSLKFKHLKLGIIIITIILSATSLFLIDYFNQLPHFYAVLIPSSLAAFTIGSAIRHIKLPAGLRKLASLLDLKLLFGILIIGSLNPIMNHEWWNFGLATVTGLSPIGMLFIRLIITLLLISLLEFLRKNRATFAHLLLLFYLIPLSYFVLQASNYFFKLDTVVLAASSIWLNLINLSILLALYLLIYALTNRIFISAGIYSALIAIISFANMQKAVLRNETILPLDLKNITILPKLVQMIGTSKLFFVVGGLILLIAAIYLLQKFTPLEKSHKKQHWYTRIILISVGTAFLAFWINFMPTQTVSWSTNASHGAPNKIMRYTRYSALQMIKPTLYYRFNGTALGFLSMIKVTAMDKPADYSRDAVQKIAEKYQKKGQEINQHRQNAISDQTIIYVLSESLANPVRIPGVKMANPLQNITRLAAGNNGGLFFSNGYGGGTANIEFEALTSLSMNNFNSSMSVPYSFLVPRMSFFPTIINEFKTRTAFHPYTALTYQRNYAFKKFGFTKFYASEDSPDKIKYEDKLGTSPLVSDAASYKNVLEQLKKDKNEQIIQLSTMQNHMPYDTNYYNGTKWSLKSNLTDSSSNLLANYTEGISITDKETTQFLQEIDKLQQNITVVIYGDHLPGIYNWQNENTQKLADYDNILHQSDYFIHSNFEEKNVGKQVISPNMINPLLFAKTGSKVSPFFALMTELMEKTPAAELGKYMDDSGKYIAESKLTKEQKEILHDYQLIMYDLTAGKKYLNNSSFYKIPK